MLDILLIIIFPGSIIFGIFLIAAWATWDYFKAMKKIKAIESQPQQAVEVSITVQPVVPVDYVQCEFVLLPPRKGRMLRVE